MPSETKGKDGEDDLIKVAILCDKSWKRTRVGLFSAFSGVVIDFFDISEKNELSNWIQSE